MSGGGTEGRAVPRARVLVVDDEPGMRRAAERVLGTDHEVAGASLPSEALLVAAEFRPDLVVCDVRMPEMDGFALVTALRARPVNADVDVIFMTGSHTEPDAMLVRAVREQAFYFIQKPFDRQVLSTLVERCLELRRLRRAERANTERMSRELGEARVFQRATLARPMAAGERVCGWRVEAEWRPCQELAGDFYDFAPLADGRLAMIVADVRGHGATAALMTGVVKSVFAGACLRGGDPVAVMDTLVRAIAPFGDDRFVTALCLRLDARTGGAEYVNAGHPAGLLWRPGGEAVSLGSTGPLVSPVFTPGSWERASVKVGPGARVLAYTDGVLECLGGKYADAAAEIGAIARDSRDGRGAVGGLLAKIASRLEGREPTDDVTVVAGDAVAG